MTAARGDNRFTCLIITYSKVPLLFPSSIRRFPTSRRQQELPPCSSCTAL